MKILPPLSEILWPSGQSLARKITVRVLPPAAILIALGLAFAWPSSKAAHPDLGDGIAACSQLVPSPHAEPATAVGCDPIDLAVGRSLLTGAPLERSSLPYSQQLTDLDRAIEPPADILRPTIVDAPSDRSDVPGGQSLAASPRQ